MKETTGNLWDEPCDALCITTNGFVKSNGRAVMGRGCAAQAARLIPGIDLTLGSRIWSQGNDVHLLAKFGRPEARDIISFPVKTDKLFVTRPEQIVAHQRRNFQLPATVPGWACVADIRIIRRSAEQLVKLTDKMGYKNVLLPRPGCGAGELEWQQVRPVIANILDDRFTTITY